MAGNVNAPRIWEGADLWVAPQGAPIPVFTADMADPWKPVGLLSEDGASEARDEDSNDFYAWGGKLVRTKRSKHKRTITVTALEDNLVVFGLINGDGSTFTTDTATGVNTRRVKIPRSEKMSFVLELFDGDVKRRRHIPIGEVTEVGEVALSESEMTAYELTITIYPGDDDTLYIDEDNDDTNVGVAPVEPAP
ncbi:hypothetical protein [Streptomyces sp. NPDC050145]|uniref:phage tail tube protein n=1 Tax=Streptomyces sp. NPDC050145 TaxID=3365602 RepID=UPI0037996A94